MKLLSPLRTCGGFYFHEIPGVDGHALTIVALHGSGADEESMLPLARSIDEEARVISVRGNVYQAGERRWFLKHTPVSFDQDSIVKESAAFAAFLKTVMPVPANALYLGYSNGGNLVHVTAMLHPGIVRNAVLLRCMPVLSRPPKTELKDCRFLVVRGRDDATYGPRAPALVRLLRSRGADAALRSVQAGHLFAPADEAQVRLWRADRAT